MSDKYYVYFISCGPKKSPFMKIGIAKDPQKRIMNLQVGNHEVLKLDSTIECRSRRHAHHLEIWLHECFSSYHVRGEWFKANPINIPRALAGFETQVEIKSERGKGIHGTKKESEINDLRSKNFALTKKITKERSDRI